MDLHVSERLRKLLPAPTKDEREQLEANIKEDGRLTDPLLYWNDGEQNIVVDGMNRWDIVDGTDIPFTTVEMDFDSYEEAELWILNHQLGRRNLLKPAAVRKLRGDLYNRLKTQPGRPPTPPAEGKRGQNVTFTSEDGKSPSGPAAETVADKAGVSPRTVKRDGARATAIDHLTETARVIADKATDKEVKSLAALAPADQNVVARAIRTGQETSVTDAIKQAGLKPTKAPKRTGSRQKGKSKQKSTAASLVDALTKKHVGQIARELTAIAEANGGEGDQFKAADDGLNKLINALREMRKGKQ